MLYKGKSNCPKCGEFEWQIASGEKEKVIVGFNFITKNVKSYDKKTKLVIANCPKCGASIETEYDFK